MREWIDRISIERWAQHADEGHRFGHLTTNLSEGINVVLKGTRNLPITALVKSTYFPLAKLFVRKGREAKAQLATKQKVSQALQWVIEENRQSIGAITVSRFTLSNSSFMVEELGPIGGWSQRNYRVRLVDQWCDYGYIKRCTIHAIVCSLHANMHDLIGPVMLMMCTASKLYLTSTK